MNLNYEFTKDELIKQCIKDFFSELNATGIPIIFSDEEPSILIIEKKTDNKIDKYPVCDLLGKYNPQTKEITIYLQGINRATEDERKNLVKYDLANYKCTKSDFYQHLLKVVILHEIGHYWFHNFAVDPKLMKESGDVYLRNKINFLENDPERSIFINEWIAQMFAYLCLTDPVEKSFMEEFAKIQPPEYNAFLKNGDLQLEIDSFKKAAGLLQLKNIYLFISKWNKNCILLGIDEISYASKENQDLNELIKSVETLIEGKKYNH